MDTDRNPPEKQQMSLSNLDSFDTRDRRSEVIEVVPGAESRWQYLRLYFTSWEGWIGNYVCEDLSYIKTSSLSLIIWFTGLSVSDHPEHMATQQAIQGLWNPILWTQRWSTHSFDYYPRPATCIDYDRICCLATFGYCKRRLQPRYETITIPCVGGFHNHRHCHGAAGDPSTFDKDAILHWNGAFVRYWADIWCASHCIQLLGYALREGDVPYLVGWV